MDPLPSGTADSNRRPEPQELPDRKHVTPLISDQSDPERRCTRGGHLTVSHRRSPP